MQVMKSSFLLRPTLFFISTLLMFSCSLTEEQEILSHEYLVGRRGFKYQLIKWSDLKADISTERPDRDDPNNLISISLTPPDSAGAPVRHYYCLNGEESSPERFNDHLKGAVMTNEGKLSLLFTDKSLASSSLAGRCKEGIDFVQGRGVVADGQVIVKNAGKKFQCRALVEFKDGSFGIIETLKHNTQVPFAEDLVSFGVKNAVMTVTGTFDEGWYYYGGVPVAIGRLRTYTSKQSNWLVLQKSVEPK